MIKPPSLIIRGVILTWFKMKQMTVMAAHARVPSIKNLNLMIKPCRSKPTRVDSVLCVSVIEYSDVNKYNVYPIAQPPSLRHRRKLIYFPTNVPEHTTHHVTQGEEIQTYGNPCQNNEGELWGRSGKKRGSFWQTRVFSYCEEGFRGC